MSSDGFSSIFSSVKPIFTIKRNVWVFLKNTNYSRVENVLGKLKNTIMRLLGSDVFLFAWNRQEKHIMYIYIYI